MRDRFQAVVRAYRATVAVDPRLNLWLAGAFLAPVLLAVLVGVLVGPVVLWIVLGVLLGAIAALFVFGRRVQAAQYAAIAGRPGAAAAVLDSVRGQWFLTPAVAVNKKQDFVHRMVGRPGVVLVAEGDSPARLKALLAKERKKYVRVAGDAPVHTLMVGDGQGDTIELGQLQWHLTKLGAHLKRKDVPKLHRRLQPLDKGNIPVPKGYVPPQGRRPR